MPSCLVYHWRIRVVWIGFKLYHGTETATLYTDPQIVQVMEGFLNIQIAWISFHYHHIYVPMANRCGLFSYTPRTAQRTPYFGRREKSENGKISIPHSVNLRDADLICVLSAFFPMECPLWSIYPNFKPMHCFFFY